MGKQRFKPSSLGAKVHALYDVILLQELSGRSSISKDKQEFVRLRRDGERTGAGGLWHRGLQGHGAFRKLNHLVRLHRGSVTESGR